MVLIPVSELTLHLESSLKRVRNMTCTCTYVFTCIYIPYLYNVHHCTNSAASSDVVCKHENALYLGPQPIPPAPFDPDHCRHEIADFYRHHIRPPDHPHTTAAEHSLHLTPLPQVPLSQPPPQPITPFAQ